MLPTVTGDRGTLLALFAVLVENAVKYRRPDAPLRVRVDVFASGPDWLVEIEDNGCGLADGDHDRILDLYARSDPDRAPGAGIGLTACRRIVEAHGGRLWLEPAAGGGTLVSFTLAVDPAGSHSALAS